MPTTLSSMTGFGRSTGSVEHVNWVWEIKSVNSRNLDLRFRLPSGYDAYESSFRDCLTKIFSRGSINAVLMIERPQREVELKINEALLQRLLALHNNLAAEINIPPPSLDGLLNIRGVMEQIEKPESAELEQKLQSAVMEGLKEAANALKQARHSEGSIIAAMMIAHVETIDGLVKNAEQHPSRNVQLMRQRLEDLIAPLLEKKTFDPDRLHQEAVLLSTKVDIKEEIDRLNAHVTQARSLIKEGGAIGRRLDFLAQEFNREANTLCSKAHDPGLTQIGLSLKTVIDQMREQAQNIE